jgi:hypothetical protein
MIRRADNKVSLLKKTGEENNTHPNCLHNGMVYEV